MKRIVIEVSGGVVQEVYCDEPSTFTIYDYDDLERGAAVCVEEEIGEQLKDGRLFRSQLNNRLETELEHIVGNLLADLPSGLFRDDDDEEGNEVNGGDLVDIMTTYARRLQAAYEGPK